MALPGCNVEKFGLAFAANVVELQNVRAGKI
jgi:hypothetical protein